jgi:SAM-dependent MidA family methyltransferase
VTGETNETIRDDAGDAIRGEIDRDGPIPFERFMDLALYGEHGFYMRPDGGSAGRRGDFITSPEVGPLFGAVLARYLDAEWERIGRSDPFTVVDVGAGPGTLARSIVTTRLACAEALRYVAVEVSPAQRARHPDGIESQSDLPAEPFDGVVVANELLDNLPFRLVVFDGGWREAHVDVDRDGRFVEVLGDVVAALPVPASGTRIGARAPIIDRGAAFVDDARRMIRAGSVLAIDYGVARTGELALRPWREWLRTYRGNQRGEHYLANPGSQDITIDVPFDQLPPPDAVRTQSQFLQRWGIDELVAEGVRVWTEQAARPGLEAMRMRSRVAESDALLDPNGLGGFLVTEWRRPTPRR